MLGNQILARTSYTTTHRRCKYEHKNDWCSLQYLCGQIIVSGASGIENTKGCECMVTAVYSLSHVHGAELWLLFWAICFAAYFGICMLIKQNRTKHGIKNVLIGMLIAEVMIDLIWAIIYYHNGTYLNYGLGAVYGLLLLVPILMFTEQTPVFAAATNSAVSAKAGAKGYAESFVGSAP